MSKSLDRRECRLGIALQYESGTCAEESRECITRFKQSLYFVRLN